MPQNKICRRLPFKRRSDVLKKSELSKLPLVYMGALKQLKCLLPGQREFNFFKKTQLF